MYNYQYQYSNETKYLVKYNVLHKLYAGKGVVMAPVNM